MRPQLLLLLLLYAWPKSAQGDYSSSQESAERKFSIALYPLCIEPRNALQALYFNPLETSLYSDNGLLCTQKVYEHHKHRHDSI